MRLDKQYKHLMEQQNVDAEVNANFYEKLENAGARRNSFRWKAALAVACIALMIPITVLAASNIISKPKVKFGVTEHFPNINAYSLRFDNIQSHPLSAFPKDVQAITDYKKSYLKSWEAAEKTLDIDLMNNTILEADSTGKDRIVDLDGNSAHCVISYHPSGEKLYYVQVDASYIVESKHYFFVKAKITVENPNLTEDEMQTLHGITAGYSGDTTISYEEYTTKEGIPVAIATTWSGSNYVKSVASFAVNNISYEICIVSTLKEQEAERERLLEVLDAYVLD